MAPTQSRYLAYAEALSTSIAVINWPIDISIVADRCDTFDDCQVSLLISRHASNNELKSKASADWSAPNSTASWSAHTYTPYLPTGSLRDFVAGKCTNAIIPLVIAKSPVTAAIFKQPAFKCPDPYSHSDESAEVEKVVLQETTLCEKCGIGAVPIDSEHGLVGNLSESMPIDSDTAALRDKARNFASSIDWIAKQKEPPPAKPDFPIRANWTKLFSAKWDDDGGFTLGGQHFSPEGCNDRFVETNGLMAIW